MKAHIDSGAGLSVQAIKSAIRLLAQPTTLRQLPRLLREGFAPARRLFIQAHNQSRIARLIGQGERVNFISSFARSGSTWTRHLLADALLQAQGIKTNTDLPTPFEQVVPDFYCDLIGGRNSAIPMPGILVKTHDAFEQLRQRFCPPPPAGAGEPSPKQAGFGNCKIVYLFRSPEDVLVSLYHLQRKVRFVPRSSLGIDEFCLWKLPEWMENMASYFRAQEQAVPLFFVCYEMMLQEPALVLSDILRWLELPHTAQMVESAVAHMEFAKLRAREELARPGASEFALRRGGAGAGCQELQAQTLAKIQERAAQLLKEANQRLARQNALHRDGPLFKQMQQALAAPRGSLEDRAASAGLGSAAGFQPI